MSAIATLGGAVLSLQLVGITPKVCAARSVRRYGNLLIATSQFTSGLKLRDVSVYTAGEIGAGLNNLDLFLRFSVLQIKVFTCILKLRSTSE